MTLGIYYTALHRMLLSCQAGVASCYFEILDEQQKRVCKTVGPSLVSREHLGYCWDFTSLSLFVGITLVDVHLNWLSWFQFLILVGSLIIILTDYMTFFCHDL